MIFPLCLASLLCLYLCYRSKRSLQNSGLQSSFRFILTSNLFDFLLPLSIVTSVYAVLSFVLSGIESDQTTLETLRNYERNLLSLKERLGYLKLSPGYSLLLIVVLFLLSLVLGSQRERMEKAYEHFEKYHKWHKRISVVITLLASFTFLGGQVYTRTDRVQARIKFLEGKYDGYQQELQDALNEGLAYEAHARLVSTFQRNYSNFNDVDTKLTERSEHVKASYSRAIETYGLKSSKLAKIKLETRNRRIELHTEIKKLTAANEQLPRTKSSRPPEDAKHLTNQKIENLRARTKQFSSLIAQRFESSLQTPFGKRIAPATLKLIINYKNSPALKGLVAEFPLLEPILSTFTDTINKTLEAQLNTLQPRIFAKAINNPGILETEISKGVNDVLTNANIQWDHAPTSSLVQEEATIQRELQELDIAAKEFEIALNRRKLELRVENGRIEEILRANWNETVKSNEVLIARNRMQSGVPNLKQPDILQSAETKIRLINAETAINEFITATRTLDEPVAQTTLLRANRIMEDTSNAELTILSFKRLVETRFPATGDLAVAALDSITSSAPSVVTRRPYESPFSRWRESPFGIERPPIGIERPPVIERPPIIKPPPPAVRWWHRLPRR